MDTSLRANARRRLRTPGVALIPLLALALWLCLAALAGPGRSLATAASLGGGGARAHTATSAPLRGINIGGVGALPFSVADREIANAHALHAGVVRVEIPWSVLEPDGPGKLEPQTLAYTDRLMADARKSGIKVIAFADSTPCWASSAPASLLRKCTPGRSSRANAWSPTQPSTYAAFVAVLAQRYSQDLAAIEIWNEPDQANEDYFAGPHKAVRYAALLRAAYPAIKAVNPNVPVLAGSLVGYNGIFLRALYAAGIKGYYNGIAVHFYSLTLASLREFRAAQLASGDSTPLWLSEFGWSSCWPRYKIQQEQACVTPKVQAQNITNVYRSLARTPWVAAQVIYELHSSKTEDFGVLNERGARKPAFAALAAALASPFGPVSPVTLSLRRSGNQVVASGSGPVGDSLQLEVFQGATLRYRALFTLDRFNRYSLALPAALGTSGLSVRIYQTWLGPSKDAQQSI
jgi:polysaccharide biosynthesis protein PslG